MKEGYDHAAGEPSALCFLQCFETVGWVTRRTRLAKQPLYPKVLFGNKRRKD